MDFKTFENDVWRTFNKELNAKEALMNALLGMQGETGEVSDIFKKAWYQGHMFNSSNVLDEIGDVLYYITVMVGILDSNLEEVTTLNMIKRGKRYPNGFDVNRSVNREENKMKIWTNDGEL